jgi:hypothetical protein
VNSRDRNFTPAKVDKRKEQIEESIQRYMSALDTADRTLPLLEFGPRYAHLTDKIKTLREQMRRMDQMKERLKAEPGEQLSLTDPDSRSMMSQAKGTPDQQEASAYRGAGSRGEPPDREHVISTQEVCHGAEQGSVPEGAVDARVLRAVRVGATV